MTTLKISDLSIGDWVDYCGRHYKVYSIEDCGFIKAKCEDDYTSSHIGKNIDYLEPIPITAEILEKNGFRKNGEYNEWNIGEWNERPFIGVSIDRQSMRVKYFGNDIFIENKVVYVHQLQRALRLVGLDIEINL